MKQIVLALLGLATLGLAASALGQVTTAEVLGVETTAAASPDGSGSLRDNSVGEVTIVVRALDANGNPVAGAQVAWSVQNRTENVMYVVGTSASMEALSTAAYSSAQVAVDGGVTDADGKAYLVVDSPTPGDARVFVTVGGVDGKTYRGRDMRVVWF